MLLYMLHLSSCTLFFFHHMHLYLLSTHYTYISKNQCVWFVPRFHILHALKMTDVWIQWLSQVPGKLPDRRPAEEGIFDAFTADNWHCQFWQKTQSAISVTNDDAGFYVPVLLVQTQGVGVCIHDLWSRRRHRNGNRRGNGNGPIISEGMISNWIFNIMCS